jgi:hypothetical protein
MDNLLFRRTMPCFFFVDGHFIQFEQAATFPQIKSFSMEKGNLLTING